MYDKYVKDIMDLYDKEQDEYDELVKKELPHEKEHEEEDKIAEKYDKLILDINKKYNIIFRYDLADAWGVQISTLIITNDKKDNVICIYDNENHKKQLENATFTTDSSKVLDIISKYENEFKDLDPFDIKIPPVLDGVHNNFYFDVNGKAYTFNLTNLWAWGSDIDEEVKVFLDLLSDLANILIKDVDNLERCLSLGR